MYIYSLKWAAFKFKCNNILLVFLMFYVILRKVKVININTGDFLQLMETYEGGDLYDC